MRIPRRTMRCKPKYGAIFKLFHTFARLIALAAPLVAPVSPVAAATAATPWPIEIRTQMSQIGALEYALRKSAGDLCALRNTASGIKIDYIEAYAAEDRPLVRRFTQLQDAPQVIEVAPDSPAQIAGVRPSDNILSINGVPVSEIRAKSASGELLADELEERLAATPEDQNVMLELSRDGQPLEIAFRGERLCATRFVLKTGEGITAFSDGRNVALSSKLADFAQNDDELAVFAGHELAHIIVRDGEAKDLRQRRAMEDRADALGADLMRCAGYDVERGLAIWRRYNRRDWLRWMRDSTHRKVPDRIRRIEAHMAEVPKTCPPRIPPLGDGN